jgi:DNA-binding GntR family transcriptional regulator
VITDSRSGAAGIYNQLKQKLLDFEIPPGSRMTETELASLFHVSRTPVREALQRLETEGLVRIRPKQGCFVRDLDIEEIAQYYRVRVALEQLAIEEAATNMPDTELQELAAEWNPAKRPRKINAEIMQARDESFHLALAQGSGNLVLARCLSDINNRIRVIRRLDFTVADRIERTYIEHNAILRALLARNVEAAKKQMKSHINKSEENARNLTLIQLAKHRRNAAARN